MGIETYVVTGVRRRGQARVRLFVAAAWTATLSNGVAHADPHIIVNTGLPVQVNPTFQEPGLPAFSFPTGGTVGSVSGDASSSSGSTAGTASTAAGSGGSDAGGAALDLMNSQSGGLRPRLPRPTWASTPPPSRPPAWWRANAKTLA